MRVGGLFELQHNKPFGKKTKQRATNDETPELTTRRHGPLAILPLSLQVGLVLILGVESTAASSFPSIGSLLLDPLMTTTYFYFPIFPDRKSALACAISALVFITKGPRAPC